MFFIMTASAVRSSSLGLNETNSVPGSTELLDRRLAQLLSDWMT
jgi:hypothetical protein